jgi:WD40-like Beta Propeller Repeat
LPKTSARILIQIAALSLLPVTAFASDPTPPALFAPGIISGPAHDLSPAFTPDGQTVYFTRANSSYSFILVSHRDAGSWSTPQIASFSGKWKDLEPTMAPDGSFLIFSSNRPASPDGKPLDGVFNGKTSPGGGGNLWRVDRRGDSWSQPVRLPDNINSNTGIFSPSIAANGILYFMQPDKQSGAFHLFRSTFKSGVYREPVRQSLGDTTSEEVDPAVAPDESFIVYSLRHPDKHDKNRLHIAFRQADGWNPPQDLGDIVNEQGGNIEARLGSDHRTLYFSTNTVPPASTSPTPQTAKQALEEMQIWANDNENIWYVSLASWLDVARK